VDTAAHRSLQGNGQRLVLPGRWVSASASYLFRDDTINLISAAATRCAPGPEPERNLKWTPRKTDR
jgi:hypothetical protein